jgi:hypothetical protein
VTLDFDSLGNHAVADAMTQERVGFDAVADYLAVRLPGSVVRYQRTPSHSPRSYHSGRELTTTLDLSSAAGKTAPGRLSGPQSFVKQ